MPQMAPMSWLLLFLFFSMMLILINALNYYLFIPKIQSKTSMSKNEIKNKNWKW